MITITGAGDHDQTDWLITMTGIRTNRTCRFQDVAEHNRFDQMPAAFTTSVTLRAISRFRLVAVSIMQTAFPISRRS
jgi:hypothetical protein